MYIIESKGINDLPVIKQGLHTGPHEVGLHISQGGNSCHVVEPVYVR
jgi:hypothetical protein